MLAMMQEVERFLRTCKSPNTAAGYRLVLARLVEWLSVRSLAFTDLTPALFEEFLNDQHQWKAVSKHLAFNVTRSFLRWQYGEEHALSKVRRKRPKSKPQPTITQAQFERLLEFFNTMTPIGARDLALFSLAAETGLRATALCNLKMADLHLESLSLIALDKGADGGEWRICKFSAPVASYLAAWLAHRQTIALPDTDTVFCSVYGIKKGKPNHRFGLLSRCREISEKVGFKFTPHVFRRFMATRMLQLKASTIATMRQGGWKDEKEFRKYITTYQLDDMTDYSAVVDYLKKR